MPKLDFTVSEVRWYAREQRVAQDLVNEAIQKGRVLISECLEGVFESHGTRPPGEVVPVKDNKGKVTGVAWGREALPTPPAQPAPPVAAALAAQPEAPPPAAAPAPETAEKK